MLVFTLNLNKRMANVSCAIYADDLSSDNFWSESKDVLNIFCK